MNSSTFTANDKKKNLSEIAKSNKDILEKLYSDPKETTDIGGSEHWIWKMATTNLEVVILKSKIKSTKTKPSY